MDAARARGDAETAPAHRELLELLELLDVVYDMS
jgi:hypothetical protein